MLKFATTLLGGIVVSTTVAWTCVVAQNDRLDHRVNDEKHLPGRPPGPFGQLVEQTLVQFALAEPETSNASVLPLMPRMDYQQAAGFGVCVQLIRASVITSGEEHRFEGNSIQCGWPMTSMIAMRMHHADSYLLQPFRSVGELRVLPARGGGHFGEPALFTLRYGLVLPARPLLVGTVVNIVLWSVCVAISVIGPRAALRRWRRSRGRCENCGHLNAGGSAGRCPECGFLYRRPFSQAP